MAKIIDTRGSLEDTVKIFDDFYSIDVNINSNEYDVVYSFFKRATSNNTIAQQYTAYLFRVAQSAQVPVLNFLQQMEKFDKIEITRYLAYYLNSLKSRTALYGIGQTPQPNMAVSRNIIQ